MTEHFLLTLPVARAGTILHGSTRGTCCICAQAVWIAPSSRAILTAQPERRVICLKCAKARPGVILPPTPAQRAEIAADRGRN